MPGPARRRGGDNAGGGGRRWGQSGSGALGPAKAGPAVAEIGRVPCRDRFSSASRSVRRRRARGPGPRGGHFGASPTTPPSDSRRNVDLDGGEAVRRRVPPRAPDRSPRTGPTGTAGSYPTPHGRTQIHGVVPDAARSYPKAPLQYDPAPQRTTARIHVRPHEPGYDRPEATAAGPVGRTTARATAPPHDPPTAPDPTRPITPTPRPQAAQHVRPTTTTHHLPRHEPPHRTTTTTNRTRAGTEPNSTRERGGGPPAVTGARRPPPSSAHTIPRIALMGASVK